VLRSAPNECLGPSFLNQVSILIQDFSVPGNNASSSFGLRLQRLDDGESMNRITEDDWPMKLPFEDCQESEGVDARSLAHQTGGDGQAEQPMSHGPAERIILSRRVIDMQWVIISRETGEEDDVRFGNGASRALPLVADREIIKRPDRPRMSRHGLRSPPYS
jgi:hypothetical protein